MNIVTCLDLEGVLLPEIWHMCATYTGIKDLNLSTRDIADYDQLMTLRIATLRKHNITYATVRDLIVRHISPLVGALDFLSWLSSRYNPVIVTDSFTQFLEPLRARLHNPFILCNSLDIDAQGYIVAHRMRIAKDGKKNTVQAFQSIGCKVIAIGDSYNDIDMIKTAELGVLFRAPETIQTAHPDIPTCTEYTQLQAILQNFTKL